MSISMLQNMKVFFYYAQHCEGLPEALCFMLKPLWGSVCINHLLFLSKTLDSHHLCHATV